ncbi:hypothetical protein ACWX0P_24985 [Vibrio mediterranei]
MKHFTDSVRKSLKREDWYAALLTALTLPDICGRLENPQKQPRARYQKWYQIWVSSQLAEKTNKQTRTILQLRGEELYALRCAFFHETGSGLEMSKSLKMVKKYRFVTPEAYRTLDESSIKEQMAIPIDTICLALATATDAWFDNVRDDPVVIERLGGILKVHG